MNSKQGKMFAFARLAALIQRMDFHFDLLLLYTQDFNCLIFLQLFNFPSILSSLFSASRKAEF